jgi:Leucine-rich repeat (LRR) protein
MRLQYIRPNESLARELREVARDASALIDVLTKDLNVPLPSTFPKSQLLDIGRSLAELPHGTAAGCRPLLQYARDSLPAIRRAFLLSEEVDLPTASSDVPPPVTRGTFIDRHLRDLIASVTTALDEYQRQAGELLEDSSPEHPVSASANETADAIARSTSLEHKLEGARNIISGVTKPESVKADNLKRQLSDAAGLNRLARAELGMPKIILGWYRRILDALRDYPSLIQKTARGFRTGVDIAEIAVHRWHEFEMHGSKFLIEELKSTCDALMAVSLKLYEHRRRKKIKGSSFEEFDAEKARAMIILGDKPPAEWISHITALSFSRQKIRTLGSLSILEHLEDLDLRGTRITDLSAISSLDKLRKLDLRGTNIQDLSALSSLPRLEWLDLQDTHIHDLRPLAGLHTLARLYLGNTAVEDVSPLSSLTQLIRLDLHQTKIHDLKPLASLELLEGLDLRGTPVSDLDPLSELSHLIWVDLAETLVEDLRPMRKVREVIDQHGRRVER